MVCNQRPLIIHRQKGGCHVDFAMYLMHRFLKYAPQCLYFRATTLIVMWFENTFKMFYSLFYLKKLSSVLLRRHKKNSVPKGCRKTKKFENR